MRYTVGFADIMNMKVENAKKLLSEAGQDIIEEKRLPNDTETQLCLRSGAFVNVWDKGTCNVQGKEKANIEAILSAYKKSSSARISRAPSNKVFVVYGHDTNARTQLGIQTEASPKRTIPSNGCFLLIFRGLTHSKSQIRLSLLRNAIG
jgi:predicted nucleotide-binding protein